VFGVLREVDPGGERVSGPVDDDGPDAVVGFETLQGVVEIGRKLRAERVHRLRAIQRDPPDVAVRPDFDDRSVPLSVVIRHTRSNRRFEQKLPVRSPDIAPLV